MYFIFGAFGILPMGLNGAATGLVIAQICAALLGLFVLFNKKGILGSMFNKSFFKFDLKQTLEIIKVGAPAAAESVFWQLAAVILTRIMLSFGEVAFAAHQLGMNAESISYMPAAGFSIAATAFIGQSVGARDRESGKIYLREIVKGSILFTSIGSFIMVFFPTFLLGLLTDEKAVISLGMYYLIVQGLAQIPQNLAGVFGGALRGAGFTKIPMIVAFVGLWGIRVPFSWILTRYFHLNIVAIWYVMSIDLLCRFILSYILYKRKDIYSKILISEKLEPSEATC
jgi:putative MATE family efflux protein